MKEIKWVFLLVVVFSSMGCASLNPNLFQNTLSGNPGITPLQLQVSLKVNPMIDKQVNNTFSYQVYNVGGNQKAVYFQNGQMVAQAPYDKYTNIKTLLQIGAISQDEYDKENTQFQADDVASKQNQDAQDAAQNWARIQGKCLDPFCMNYSY